MPCDVENDFPNFDATKRDLDLYKLEDAKDNIPSLSEDREIETPYPVIAKNSTILQTSGSAPLNTSGSVLDSESALLGIQDFQVAHRRR